MADSKITALTALTGANLATTDVFEVSDISDTTMDASGTSKKMTATELATGLATVRLQSRSVSSTTADSSAVNTTSETVVATQAIPTTASVGDIYRLIAYGDSLNNSGGAVTYTAKVICGATTVLTTNSNSLATSANRRQWRVEVELLVVVAASDQRIGGQMLHGAASAANFSLATNTSGVGRGTATEDLTAGKNLQVSITMGTAGANIDFVCHESYLEVIKR